MVVSWINLLARMSYQATDLELEQILLKLAKKFSIKTVLLQHGSMLDSNEAINYNKSQGIFPILSDKFFAWNTSSKKCVLSSNCSDEKIKIVGNEKRAELWVTKTFLGSHYPQLGYPQLFIFWEFFYPQF